MKIYCLLIFLVISAVNGKKREKGEKKDKKKDGEGHKTDNKDNKGDNGKTKPTKEVPFAILQAPTCDNEGIQELFNLAPEVLILRRDGEGGRREFLLGCTDHFQEPTYNIINCWPENNGKPNGQDMYGLKKLEISKQIDRETILDKQEINTVDFRISCVRLGTAAAPVKCTEQILMKELSKQVKVHKKKRMVQHAFHHAIVSCKIGDKAKRGKKKNKQPTKSPLAGQPLFLECDGIPYYPNKNSNEAFFWRPARDSPITNLGWFAC